MIVRIHSLKINNSKDINNIIENHQLIIGMEVYDRILAKLNDVSVEAVNLHVPTLVGLMHGNYCYQWQSIIQTYGIELDLPLMWNNLINLFISDILPKYIEHRKSNTKIDWKTSGF